MGKLFYSISFTVGIILFTSKICIAQNLNFSYPVNYLNGVTTDHAIDITNFKGGFFVTWKNEGTTGDIGVCYLGRQYESDFIVQKQNIGQQSAFAPVLRVFGIRVYLFWIGLDGNLKYVINNTTTSFDVSKVYTLNADNTIKFTDGITAAAVGDNIIVASHYNDKNHLVYALLQAEENGTLKVIQLHNVPNITSDSYPFIVPIATAKARILLKGYKNTGIYSVDFDINENSWTNPKAILKSKSNVSPAIYSVFNSPKLFYVWKGEKGDTRLYYTSEIAGTDLNPETVLPAYFSTNYPVSICNVDERKFILSYVGEDKKLYISYFTNYNPANWIETELMPLKADKTLKDILLPGSHDSGLSVLNGVGGSQSGSINECNTLTQTQDINHQLNAGIRMFDLRIGTFNGAFYTKHCASDCMADAIGGAYGEKFSVILNDIKDFLLKNKKEFILITFSHFCEKETPMKMLIDTINNVLDKELMYNNQGKNISQIRLKDIAGKVIITFEGYSSPQKNIDSSSMKIRSNTFLNIRRAYAATNKIDNLLTRQKAFFFGLSNNISSNDLIRLDWQLTQSGDEAAMICNDFQSSKTSPLVDGAMLLTNVIRKHKSIINLSVAGNKYISKAVNDWIESGVIDKTNKPNILYVDAAGAWITDYCIELNESKIYN
jgi:hypothetical protein